MTTPDADATAGNPAQNGSDIDGLKALFSLLAGAVIIAGFALAKYFLDAVPEWLILALMGVGSLTLLLAHGWKATTAFVGLAFAVFSLLPSNEDPMAVWHERIQQPRVGDYYPLDIFVLRDQAAPDDNRFVIHKVIAFDQDSITFTESTRRYHGDTVNQLLKSKKIAQVEMHPGEVSLSKARLGELLDQHSLGGVFRLEK
ncbi:hypothetical protein [Gallaecimonas sp. GXIMD4217]|uniref:hypothetical protein n=1 Tax=Gallaecimonas sp. GXIMD4217 TaxID=3131927 RepID=UPI00311B0744